MGLLGLIWARAFLEVEDLAFSLSVKGALRSIGASLDAGTWSKQPLPRVQKRRPGSAEPRLSLDLKGMAVVLKPPDWEVDGRGRALAEQESSNKAAETTPAIALLDGSSSATAPILPLSAWLRRTFPRQQCPVPWAADLDFGFLHRLDVPSSGLILCGTTATGLLALRWQLDTYRVERQYAVWGHGLAPVEFRAVTAHIDAGTVMSRRSYIGESSGKPARTWFKVAIHLSASSLDDILTAFIIRIRTGRRHQIRAHLRHGGFPTAVDAKYGLARVPILRLASYELAYVFECQIEGANEMVPRARCQRGSQ